VTEDHLGATPPGAQRPGGLAELALALGYSYLSEAECVAELHRAGGVPELEEALGGLTRFVPSDPAGAEQARRLLEAALPPRSDHVVAFYDDEAFLTRTVAQFVRTGLVRGETVLVVATARHHEGFRRELAELGVDTAPHLRAGRYVALDANATLARLAPDGELDVEYFREQVGGLVRRALAAGVRIRAFGEMVALLWERGELATALQLEDLWNDLEERTPFPLLCGYPLRGFASDETAAHFHAVCERHTGVTTESYASLVDDGAGEEVVVLERHEPGGRATVRRAS
jgi:hypothetical protein